MTRNPPKFDAIKYKQTTRQQWNSAAEAWHRWSPLLSRWLGPATETMLDMCHVDKGSRVLDVAAGAGEQTVTIAKRVGESGHVLATDISPDILGFARESANLAGMNNIHTQVIDGESLTELDAAPFDAVIFRAGFNNIQVEAINAPVRVTSAAECLQFEQESFGALHQMLSGLSDTEKDEAWNEIEEALSQFEVNGQFEGPCEMLVAVGSK